MNQSLNPIEKLPQGWKRVPLGETAAIVRGISFPKEARKFELQEGSVACLRTANVQKQVDWNDLWFVPEEYVKLQSRYIQLLDILISVSNSLELVGKVAQVTSLPHKSTLGAFISLLRPSSEICAKFYYYQLTSTEIQSEIRRSASTTTNISNISSSRLGEIALKVPPLPEQHRIVAEIEKHFTRLDASVAALKRAQANLKRYRASLLKASCEGRLVPTEAELARSEHRDYKPADRLLERILAERRARWESQPKRRGKYKEPTPPDTSDLPELPEGWMWASMESLIVRSEYGTSVKCSYDAEGVSVIRIPNIAQGDLDLADMKYATQTLSLDAESALQVGDVLMCRTNGSINLIGKTAVVKTDLAPLHTFASYLLRFRFAHTYLLPAWFHIFATSIFGRRYIEGHAASSAGQHNVSLTLVHAMPIPLPPLPEQHRIVAEVERQMSVIQQAELAVDASLKRTDRLRQSILKQAFLGQLVPQDPNDEPASVLLERIRTEREASQSRPKPKRRAPRKTPA